MNTIYLDNAATTFPKPEEVYQFTDQFYRTCGVNVGRGQHRLASKASCLVQETREALQTFYNALNQGQEKQIIKNEAVRIICDRFGVEYEV